MQRCSYHCTNLWSDLGWNIVSRHGHHTHDHTSTNWNKYNGEPLSWSQILLSTIFYIFTIMHLDINNTFRIDYDPFRMILKFIPVANTFIIGYPNHPQACGLLGILGSWVGETKCNDLC